PESSNPPESSEQGGGNFVNLKPGDADCKGTADIIDVILMNRVYVGIDKISDQGLRNVDFDHSGKIELADSMNVLRLLVHLITEDEAMTMLKS
ncbi:MAG: hypothetical protein K2H29_09415, partial [Oscillospiraceae bacterium]|nr:hypothetical protein [Oscillospiraceae bacterium]